MRGLLAGMLAIVVASCAPSAPRPRYYEEDRGADRDGDGVADRDDPCADEAEDGLPPKANDGCPADDPDNDGIGRLADRCPTAKEDGLPPYPADGCPSAAASGPWDSDNDGVADAIDKCPGEREDNLAPDPSDGCPSPDRDRDGIADALDRCPDQPETYHGFQDGDGCPDTEPPATQVSFDPEGKVLDVPLAMKLDFPSGSTELGPDGQAAAAQIAKLIVAHPEWDRIEIEGHASSKGDEKVNASITHERARSVARALVANGVDAKRLVPIGYGEFCPRVDRGDEVDDPVNRRVEIKVVRINGHWQDVPRGCWRAKRAGIDPTKATPGISSPAPVVIETHGGGV